MKLTKTEFKGTLLRNQNMKIDLADMKAHQDIIGDNTFKKAIRKEERKKKMGDIEDIFEKSGKKKIEKLKNRKVQSSKKNSTYI